jgi:hypothetical protein
VGAKLQLHARLLGNGAVGAMEPRRWQLVRDALEARRRRRQQLSRAVVRSALRRWQRTGRSVWKTKPSWQKKAAAKQRRDQDRFRTPQKNRAWIRCDLLPEIQLHPPDGLGLVLAAHAHEPLAPAHARALHSKHAYHHTNLVQHARTHMHTPCSPERVTESTKSHRFVRVQVATKS